VVDSAALSNHCTKLHTATSHCLRDWNHPLLINTDVHVEKRIHATPLLPCECDSSLHGACTCTCAQPHCSLSVHNPTSIDGSGCMKST
jgi:hypothetical protein